MNREAKIPEGVTIDKPEPEARTGTTIPDFEVDPTLPRIVYPHYTNNERTELACTLIRPDGSAHMEKGIPADPNHPLFKDIEKQYRPEEIRHNTNRQIQIETKTNEAAKEQEKQARNSKAREDIWEMKTTMLALDPLKEEQNKEFRRAIRKSKTIIEAQAYGIAAILRSYDSKGK